jgi:hypothetical protein
MGSKQATSNENLTPAAINSLTKELAQLISKPEEGIRVCAHPASSPSKLHHVLLLAPCYPSLLRLAFSTL